MGLVWPNPDLERSRLLKKLMEEVRELPLEQRRAWATILRRYASSLSKDGLERPTTPTSGST
jgi:hypothetical protein